MSLYPEADIPRRDEHGRFTAAQTDRTLSHGEPAAPLLKVLPIKRWIPQDVHSVMDYVDGLTTLSGYFLPEHKRDDAARWASLALGATVIGTSLLTDYRLSAVKLIPIRAHETADYLWGASAIALPFLLGYWKSSPRVAFTHIAVGAGALLASLFTDYRSYKETRKQARKAKRSQADMDALEDPIG
jgi:hypothetical protein